MLTKNGNRKDTHTHRGDLSGLFTDHRMKPTRLCFRSLSLSVSSSSISMALNRIYPHQGRGEVSGIKAAPEFTFLLLLPVTAVTWWKGHCFISPSQTFKDLAVVRGKSKKGLLFFINQTQMSPKQRLVLFTTTSRDQLRSWSDSTAEIQPILRIFFVG